MKICFVVPNVYCYINTSVKGSAGGAERQIYYLGTEIAKDPEWNVNFCVADFGQNSIEQHAGIKVWKSFSFKENKIKASLKLYKTLKQIDADVYIFRSASLHVALSILFTKIILKKKVDYMVASDAETNKHHLSKANGKIASIAMRFAFKKADRISVQSHFQKQAFAEVWNIKVNGILKNIYKISIKEKEIDIQRKNIILWVGRCDRWKQPEIFIRLATKFPNEKFVMICTKAKDEKYFKYISTLAAHTNNTHHITEFIDKEKLKEYYLKAKIYSITSISEGFSNTMMEAMEAKCPILSLNVNPDNILNDYKMGYHCSSEEELEQRLEQHVNNKDLQTEFGNNARKYLEENHNVEDIVPDFKGMMVSIFFLL